MAEYFDVDHANAIGRLGARFTARSEWPTWLLIVAVYGGWLAVMLLLRAGTLSLALATPLLILIAAWHMSLQHELLHGHPTRREWLNRLLGYPALAIWYPYTLYREAHLAHHRDDDLTVPGVDPEGNYVPRGQWAGLPRWLKALWVLRKTFLGRLVVGPPMSVGTMLARSSPRSVAASAARSGCGRPMAPAWRCCWPGCNGPPACPGGTTCSPSVGPRCRWR